MNVRIRIGVAVTVGLMSAATVGSDARQSPSWPVAITSSPSPAPPNSAEPQLTVSDRGVLLSWVERDGQRTTLRFAERTAAGWTETRTAASGERWSTNAVDVPSVLRLSNRTLAAHWLEKSGAGMHANDIRLSLSHDGGQTWAPPLTPHGDASGNERGFVSLVAMDGSLGVIWLDSAVPSSTSPDATAGHGAPRGGDHGPGGHQTGGHQTGHQGHGRGGSGHEAMGARHDMTVRFAAFDGTGRRVVEHTIDRRACECCPTAAAATADGLLTAFRNRSDDEIRDIHVARLEHGRWSEPTAVHADNWRIPGCPINGPALSADRRTVALAWYTAKQDQGQAYAAFSRDSGRTFGSPIRLDDAGSLGRVGVQLLADGSALATWVEMATGGAQFRVRRISDDGARSAPLTIATLAAGRAGGSPRIARHRDEIVFAWTESQDGKPHVRTATARIPVP